MEGSSRSVAQKQIAPLRVVVVTMLFSSLGLFFWLTANYQRMCPTTPNEQAGAIYPLDEHGRFVYLTSSQHRNVAAAEAYFIVSWFCAGAVEIRNGWLRRARKRRPPVYPE
jgi:hypothetical protein